MWEDCADKQLDRIPLAKCDVGREDREEENVRVRSHTVRVHKLHNKYESPALFIGVLTQPRAKAIVDHFCLLWSTCKVIAKRRTTDHSLLSIPCNRSLGFNEDILRKITITRIMVSHK